MTKSSLAHNAIEVSDIIEIKPSPNLRYKWNIPNTKIASKLLTKAIIKKMPAIYSTDNVALREMKVIVKYFTPDAQLTWWIFEGEQLEDGDWKFFGLCKGDFIELGYTLLSQLCEIRGPFGLAVERDRHYSQEGWKLDIEQLAKESSLFNL